MRLIIRDVEAASSSLATPTKSCKIMKILQLFLFILPFLALRAVGSLPV